MCAGRPDRQLAASAGVVCRVRRRCGAATTRRADRTSGGNHRDDDLLEPGPGLGIDDAGRVELSKRLVAAAAGLRTGEVAGPRSLEDGDDLFDVAARRAAVGV